MGANLSSSNNRKHRHEMCKSCNQLKEWSHFVKRYGLHSSVCHSCRKNKTLGYDY